MNVFIDQFGRQWLNNNVAWASPYNQNGSVGYANVRYVEEWAKARDEEVVDATFRWSIGHDRIELQGTDFAIKDAVICAIYDDSGSKGMAVRMDTGLVHIENLVTEFRALENYIVFDEDVLADVEREWLEEAIMEQQNTLLHFLYKKYPNFENWWLDHYLDLMDDISYSCHDAMNEVGYYPTFESDHCYLETDRFIEQWAVAFLECIREHYRKA